MANLAQIQSIAQGQFFVKDSLGNLTELKVGDTVSLNDIIVAASSNTDLSKIEILFDTNELIILSQGEQLLDATLLASTFGNEELAFDKQEVDETLNAWNNAQDGDETDMETAAGDVTEQATNAGDERAADGGALRSKFNSRDGDATDIVSDLREASWTGGIERTIEDSENMLLEQPLPVVYTIIEGIDVVNEGDSANYVVKLQDAAGNPVIATQDTIIYVRYTNKTTQDGDTQYNNENIIEVVIKAGTSQTEFTIKTNDDYLADNGEIYNVSITGNNSTEFDMRTGDVAGNKTNVDTTILDNSNPKTPIENGGYGSEDIVFAIIEGTTAVKEGDTAQYVVKLVDKDGNPVTVTKDTEVTIKYTNKTTQDGDTQYKDNDTIKITIKAGENSSDKFDVDTIDDYLADNGEKFNLEITNVDDQGQFEKVNIGDINVDKTNVDTTILDNTTDKPNDPSTTETNGMEKVILKIVAVDKDGNPLFEVDGKTFKTTSEVVEGDSAYYKVFAFAPDSKEFNTDTKLPDILQDGTVTVKTGDIGAIGVQSQTANDGSQDYISKTQSNIKVGETIFTVKTIDDYKAETKTNETFKVEIENGSYKHPNNDGKDAIYENVTIDPTVATTIIVDNNSTKNADVVVGGSDTNSITYGAEDTVYAVITANKSSVAEGEVVTYTVKLVDYKGNEVKVSNPTDVTIKFSGSTTNPADLKDLLKINGIEVTDTTKDTFTIEIPKDKSSINFTIETKDDAYTEGKESYTLKIEDVDTNEFENIKFNEYTGLDTTKVPNPSNTTTTEINDNSTEVKIVLVAVGSATTTIEDITDSNGKLIYEDKNITPESGKLYYVAVAVDKDNNVLIQDGTVKVSTYDVAYGAKGGNSVKPPLDGSEDYQSLKDKEVSLGEVFDVQTNDDYVRDNNETFTVKIDSIVDGSKYENPSVDITRDTVTSTIKDNVPVKNHQVDNIGGIDGTVYGKEDTVYVKIEGNPTVVEGGEVEYTVKLVDSTGKEVKVTSDTKVTVTFGTNKSVSDGEVELKGTSSNNPLENGENITIIIPKDGNSASFTIKTKDDFIADNNEIYNLKITDIDSKEFENLVYDDKNGINTTIKDGVTLGTPKNAYVDEDKFYENRLDGTNGENTNKTNISDKQSLGIKNPNKDNGYTLSFASKENNIPDIKLFKGNADSKDGLSNLTSDGKEIKYKFTDNNKSIIGYVEKDGGGTEDVFKITLNKDSALVSGSNPDKITKDSYTYTQYKNIDHPIGGSDKTTNDDDITFEFGFQISDQLSTSDVHKFKVTVNDSTPLAGDNTLIIYEDNDGKTKGAYTFVLSDEGFQKDPKDPSTKGQIEIDNNDGKGYQTVAKDGIVSIYDGNEVVGTLKNNGNGTLTFKPNEHYSKYEANGDGTLPNFKYIVKDTDGDFTKGQINIHVKPVVDGTTIEVKNVETIEDTKNTAEGQDKVSLGLVLPTIIDNKDENSSATKGDHGERVGELTLNFTNGDLVKGVKLLDKDGNSIKYKNGEDVVITHGTSNNPQKIKIVIVDENGKVDYSYHTKDVQLGQNDTIYLTKEAYEGLKINHAEDNDRDIKIKISTKTYEVNDDGGKLSDGQAKDQGKIDSKDMIVVIKPVTDPIEIHWDNTKDENGKEIGTISADKKTFTFTESVKEGEFTLDLNKFLSNTSGTKKEDGHQGKGGDLDGSEKRGYWIKGLPVGTKITITNPETNQKETVTVKEGEYDNGTYLGFTLGSSNTQEDPKISFEFPPHFSGEVKATLELQARDQGYDTGWGIEKEADWGEKLTDEVRFNIFVDPVADDATVKVGQPVGYEDAGRTTNDKNDKYDKNIQDKDGSIKHPENGIALDIKVTSTDKDGSETFTVTIKDIPNGSGLYAYDNSTNTYKLVEVSKDGQTIKIDGVVITNNTSGNISVNKGTDGKFEVEIKDYQNSIKDIHGKYDIEPPKFIPPHNEHGDFTLNVEAKTVDRVYDKDGNIVKEDIQTVATSKPITVIVKDVADSVVGNDYNQETLVATPNTKDEVKGTHKPYNAIVNEDTEIKLSSIFNHDGKGGFDSTKLSSYDSASEDLTIVIKDLPKDVTLEGNVNYINGQYIFKASDIGGITIKTPSNYSGELNFGITYITTERGEVVDGKTIASKTFGSEKSTDNVSIFVKPTIDAEFKSSTTKAEDIDATVVGGKSYYNLNLGINKNGDNDETLEEVVIYESDEYTLFIKDENGDLKPLTYTNGEANIPLKDLGSIYVQAKENENGEVNIKGKYTVKDSHYGTKDSNYETTQTKDFTHTLKINPVADKPELKIESISDLTNSEVNGTKVSIKNSTASFTVNTKTTSIDTDGSEKVVKIVISGVPQGVTIANISDKLGQDKEGVSLYEHNGVYVIEVNENITSLNGILENIKFDINGGNFIDRDITITTYTEDSGNGDIKQDSQTINIIKDYGTGGTGQGIELKTQSYEATEDTKFSLINIFDVSGGQQTGDIKIKVTNGTIEGYTPDADGEYTIKLKGNAADIGTILSQIKVIPDVNFNNNKGQMQLTISGFGLTDKKVDVSVTPVTDEGIITITPVDSTIIDENGEFKFDIKFENNVDVGTTLKDNVIYIKAKETYKDSSESSTGKLYYIDNSGNKVELANDGKFEITGDYTINKLPKFVYEAGKNRNGDVSITVSTENKESNADADNYTLATGSTSITVQPVVSSEIKVEKVQDGIEDGKMASIKLNVVKADPSEKFESVLIKVDSGVAVYYDNGTKLAMNLGGDSWLIPVSGDGKTLPEIFFKGKEHLAGNIGFKATINAKDGEAKVTKELTTGSVTITEVADGVTIDPTKTGIDKNAFEWTTLNLNANMKDVDGSETMSLELSGLGANAQFRVDGTDTLGSTQAVWDNATNKWTISGIKYDQINNIQFTNDKTVNSVGVKAWTVENDKNGIPLTGDNAYKSAEVTKDFKLDIKDVGGILSLEKDINLDFSKLDNSSLKGINEIDLGAGNGKNELLNLTLEDVLSIGTKDVKGNINLTILGDSDDKVTFKNEIGKEWSSNVVNDDKGNKLYTEWSNTTGDTTVTVKVEQPISDGITN
ncbi:hypothetical protein [Aliarcobacter cryaerophilus]|uniref:hypothetical protein n=1 Tax=Aliarcobacter cryaerophilus TaxID=28198 RepID=UPI003DA64A96